MKRPNILAFICLLGTTAIALASPQPPIFQMHLVPDGPSTDSEPMIYITHNEAHAQTNVLNIQRTILLDQTALESVKPGKDALGQPVLDIIFTRSGATQFADVTRKNIHKRLAIVIAGQICEAPIIQTEIPGGKAQISGTFSKKEANDLAKKINDALAEK